MSQVVEKKTTVFSVNAADYLDIGRPLRVKEDLRITVSERAFVPQINDIQADWVASVAAPAFKLIARQRGKSPARSFASIGTGVGLDALAAIEILGATEVGVTDLYPDVVDAAAGNIASNTRPEYGLKLYAGHGDLLTPLADRGVGFDVIYENLPNLPLADAAALEVERTSAGYVPPRLENVPQFASDWMLVLHYLALRQARDFLNPGGVVLSTLGGRVPLGILAELASSAGLKPSFLTYTWKVQGEAEDIIGSYAEWQRQGLGPFHFYRAEALEEAFTSIDLEETGLRALEIEKQIAPLRLDAIAAWEALQHGDRIGHTVAVLKSELD